MAGEVSCFKLANAVYIVVNESYGFSLVAKLASALSTAVRCDFESTQLLSLTRALGGYLFLLYCTSIQSPGRNADCAKRVLRLVQQSFR